MSIIIKGMEMPKSCYNCQFLVEASMAACVYCAVNGRKYPEEDSCPLIEIPPHGRLIEADKLMDKIRRYGGGGLWSEEELYFTIKDMDTIIEAEV